MHRAGRLPPVLPLLLAMALAGCAKSKPNETAPTPAPSGSAATASARTVAPLLCTDGVHRRGDHWKVDCNGCRCGADGDIVCTGFPCAEGAGSRDAAR